MHGLKKKKKSYYAVVTFILEKYFFLTIPLHIKYYKGKMSCGVEYCDKTFYVSLNVSLIGVSLIQEHLMN